jgi:hypothetical protein
MLPSSQFIILVILILVALVLLNREASHPTKTWEDPADEASRLESGRTKPDQNQLSS